MVGKHVCWLYDANVIIIMGTCKIKSLFFIVNLGRALLDKGKDLPNNVHNRIKAVVDTNEKNLNYFRNKTKTDVNYLSRDYTISIYH